ncbi:MAG: hypothetical protein K2W85_12560 [Phycisphaerales bacterium]|nr:hypothetical protein [Phycisphaerales bacterium]
MSAGRGSRNNVLAGIFVLASVILTVVVVVILSNIGERLQPRHPYVVRFSVVDGAEGLDRGAAVKIGGQRVGRVTSTKFVYNDVTGEPEFVDVAIEIPTNFKLYSDADVQLLRPLLGTGSTINIVAFTGMAQVDSKFIGPPRALQPGDTVIGRLGAPGFIAQSDYARIQAIIARIDRISEEVEPRVGSIMANADAAVADVRSITGDARKAWPEWEKRITEVLARIDKASEPFEQIVKNVSDTSVSIKDGVTQAQELLAKGKAAIDENRKSLDEIVENVRQLTGKANTEAYDKVLAAVKTAQDTLDSARSAAKQVDDLLVQKSPELSEIITNASLAANQLKLATVEIRSAPWRLLYQPTKKELENELLYNSVRQYSTAVGELRQAAEALRSVAERAESAGAGVRPADKVTLDALNAKLKDAFDKYQEQERAFLERWSKADK